jgi:alkanesulfonate monooxygenase SsuD/methylene tetrahydromethanopterin reductase-like flavin-dependent oxidoreductase (luciferase family)
MTAVSTVHPWVAGHAGRIGFGIQMAPSFDWAKAKEIAEAAEQLGFDSLWLPDHPLIGWDSWTMLAGLAEATKRIRLGTMVSCVYYRQPVQLARVVADVDRISGGRVVLGIGSGDMPWEFEQMGLTYPPQAERAAVLEEALKVVPALLRGEEVRFAGDHFRVQGAQLRPPAVQQPYVPVLVAGGGAKTTLRLTALYADANNIGAASWAGGAFTPDDAQAKFEVLKQRCDEAGRPFDAILRTTQVGFFLADSEAEAAVMRDAVMNDPVRGRMMTFLERIPMFCTPSQAVEHLKGLRRAGFQHFIVGGSETRSIERFASQVMRPLLDGAA